MHHNNLTPIMQARLDKWKANLLHVKSAEVLKKKHIPNFVPRKGDYGDDLTDFQNKETKYFDK